MSENVFIEGLASGVPQWATEKTTEKVLAAVKNNSGRTEAVKSAIERLQRALTVSHQDQNESARKVETALGEVADATKDSKKHSAEQGKQAKEAASTLREASGALQSAATAQQAEAALRDSAGEDTGAAQASEQLDELGKRAGSLGRVLQTEATRMTRDTFFNFNRSLSSGAQSLGRFGAPLTGASRMLGRLASAGGKAGIALGGLALTVGGLAGFLGALVRIVQDSSRTLKAMNDVGLTQIQSATELARLQGNLAMSSEQLTSLFQEYAREMGTFGFQSLENLVRGTGEAEQAMHRLGLTLAEGATFGAQFLRQQRMASIFEMEQTVEENVRFQNTMQNLTAFSRILNVSRQEIMKATTEIMEQEQLRARFAAVQNRTQREEMQEQVRDTIMMFAALGPEGRRFGELFGRAVGALDPMLVEDLYGFLPFAGEAVMNLMDMARRAAAGIDIDPLQRAEAFEEFGNALERSSESTAFMAQMGDQQAMQAMAMLAQFREARERFQRDERSSRMSFAEYMRAEEERTQRLVQSQVQLQDVFNRIRLRFNEALLRIFEHFVGEGSIEDAVEKLGTLFDSVGEGLLQFSLILEEDGGLMRALSEGIAKAMDVIIRGIADGMTQSNNLLVRIAGRAMGGVASAAERRERDIRQEAGIPRAEIGFTDFLGPTQMAMALSRIVRRRMAEETPEGQAAMAQIRVQRLIGADTEVAKLISTIPSDQRDMALALRAAREEAINAGDIDIFYSAIQEQADASRRLLEQLQRDNSQRSRDEEKRHQEHMEALAIEINKLEEIKAAYRRASEQ